MKRLRQSALLGKLDQIVQRHQDGFDLLGVIQMRSGDSLDVECKKTIVNATTLTQGRYSKT